MRRDEGLKRFGPWAVVTGASSGIGREMALRLAELGLHVVVAARDDKRLREVAAAIGSRGSRARVIAMDLSEPGSAGRLAAQVEDLDVGLLVHSAGYGRGGELLESDLPVESAMVDLNCRATLELSYLFGRRFAGRRRGALVLLSSIVAFQGVPRAANYAATKAYVQSLGEALAAELGGRGVQVLTATPGPVESGFAARAGMTIADADTAERVSQGIVQALLRGRTRVTPGRKGKLLVYSLLTAPRRLRTRIMAGIMRGMTRGA